MVKLTQNSFMGGQLDYEMLGRQDYSRYSKGATKLVNFNIMRRGGITKRHGFDAAIDLCDSSQLAGYSITPTTKTRIVPFAWTKERGFVLVFVPNAVFAVSSAEPSYGHACRVYTIPGAEGVYSGGEIEEIDYVQCGDVMFLAHQNHPPAKISHTYEGGLHSFSYETLNVSSSKYGVPSISTSSVTRIPVKSKGGTFTESYVATAVFADGETLPSTEYSRGGVANDGTTETANGSTSYCLPWTESQEISVSVKVVPRSSPNGNVVYPNEIRLYKKAFNYYGLVATKKIKGGDTPVEMSFAKLSTSYESDPNGYGYRDLYNAGDDASGVASMDKDAVGTAFSPLCELRRKRVGTNSTLDIGAILKSDDSTVKFVKGLEVRIVLAGAYIEWTEDPTTHEAVSATLQYKACRTGSVTADGALAWFSQSNGTNLASSTNINNAVSSPSGSRGTITIPKGPGIHDESMTVQRNADPTLENYESEQQFRIRASAAMSQFLESISADRADQNSEYYDPDFELFPVVRYILPSNFAQNAYLLIAPALANAGECVRIGSVCVHGSKEVSATVTFRDNNIMPDASVTPPEALDDMLFLGTGNYPSSVSLSQQRLVWASTKKDPARVFMSQVGDFYTYNSHQIQKADDAIDFTLPITRFPRINHIVEMRRLLMFNSACEWMVDSASSASGITYETIQAYPQSYSGSKARLKPIVCNNSVIFCERSGQGVRRFAWDLANDGFAGRDISILSSSIFAKNPIVDWTYQQFPFSTLWCALSDGTAATLEYMEEQEIIAWATHRHGGGRFLGFATSHGISPPLDLVGDSDAEYRSDHEEVFALVQRGYEDGQGVWHATGLWLERMRPSSEPSDSVYHSLCLDSLRILTGAGNGNWPSDWDVQNEEWLDLPQNAGLVYVADLTEDGKVLTREQALDLCREGATVYEGFAFNADFMSVFPAVSASTVGAGQFDVKDIGNVGLRLMASHGGTVRAEGCPETEPIRYEDDPGALKNASFGGGTATFHDLDASNVKPVGINSRDGRMHVEQDLPWPFTVIMYEVDLELEVASGRR